MPTETSKAILLTEEQERDFERIKLRLQYSNDDLALEQLLVLLGILDPLQARRRFHRYYD